MSELTYSEHKEARNSLKAQYTCERILDGGKNPFYNISGCEDVDDLGEHWSMKFDEFNCLKALVGIAKGARHDGTTPLRDAKKLLHYANRIVARLEKES